MPTGRSAADWLADRVPAPPPALAERVAAQLGDAPLVDVPDAVTRCVAAAEATVGRLLDADETTRASALDLLAADALATYAFELASERPEELPARTREAMTRFAALASRGPTGVPTDAAVGAPSLPTADAGGATSAG